MCYLYLCLKKVIQLIRTTVRCTQCGFLSGYRAAMNLTAFQPSNHCNCCNNIVATKLTIFTRTPYSEFCVFLILILSIFILKLRWRACVCLTTASAIASLLQRHLDDIVGSNMANIILANINIANITANIVLLDYSYSTQQHIFKGLSVSMHKFNTVLGLPS